jgi:hypothetical protein
MMGIATASGSVQKYSGLPSLLPFPAPADATATSSAPSQSGLSALAAPAPDATSYGACDPVVVLENADLCDGSECDAGVYDHATPHAEHGLEAALVTLGPGGDCRGAPHAPDTPVPPSAPLRICSRNLRGLHLHTAAVTIVSFDVQLLQEAEVPEIDVVRVEATIRKTGRRIFWRGHTALS